MSDISRLVVAWVSAQQRYFCNSTRGIATVEQRLAWEAEAEQIIADHEAELRADERRKIAEEIRAIDVPEHNLHDQLPSDHWYAGQKIMRDEIAALLEGGGE